MKFFKFELTQREFDVLFTVLREHCERDFDNGDYESFAAAYRLMRGLAKTFGLSLTSKLEIFKVEIPDDVDFGENKSLERIHYEMEGENKNVC